MDLCFPIPATDKYSGKEVQWYIPKYNAVMHFSDPKVGQIAGKRYYGINVALSEGAGEHINYIAPTPRGKGTDGDT